MATKASEIIASKDPAIYKAIQEGIERVNAKATSNAQRVQKWVILDRDFSISGGELGESVSVRNQLLVFIGWFCLFEHVTEESSE